MAPPVTAPRLSHLATSTLSRILELKRTRDLNLPTSGTLSTTISKNLTQLADGIEVLELDESVVEEVLVGLSGQYDRLVGLVQELGVEVQVRRNQSTSAQGRTGKLVDAGDEDNEESDALEDGDGSGVPLQDLQSTSPHVAISMPPEHPERDIERMEQDEEEMRRANAEVLQMQKRMMDDQDETLNSLSSAIARQHKLSLHISSELEMQSNLLDDTDAALDRTETGLRRASGRLNHYSQKARNTGSTGLIVLLVVLLLILIVLFKA